MRRGRIADQSAAVLDASERALVLILFIFFLLRIAPRYRELLPASAWPDAAQIRVSLGAALLLISEGLAVCFVLIRPWGRPISGRPLDWILGFAGVAVPLLAHPATAVKALVWISEPVMLGGLLLQIAAKLTLARSFGVVPAIRAVKAGGPYRFVRHPMYLGYSLTHAGFLVGYPSAYNASLYASALLIDISRLLREEEILSGSPAYLTYSGRVRYRLLPKIF